MKRKHIGWKTKCAAALAALEYLRRPGLSYDDVKRLGLKRFLKRWHFDHNILHETGHKDRDAFWNLTPMHVKDHIEKTRRDAKLIAKGRRIRHRISEMQVRTELFPGLAAVEGRRRKRKIRSRGFDKTRRRRMDGTVERRK